jgi:hypothetical protein
MIKNCRSGVPSHHRQTSENLMAKPGISGQKLDRKRSGSGIFKDAGKSLSQLAGLFISDSSGPDTSKIGSITPAVGQKKSQSKVSQDCVALDEGASMDIGRYIAINEFSPNGGI